MLTADEITAMQDVQEDNLPDVCAVVALEMVRDARGNVTENLVVQAAQFCRVKPVSQANSSAQEAVILEKIGVIDAWKIRVPKSFSVREQDRLLVTVEGIERTMEVVSAPGLKSYQTIDTVYAVEIR